MSERQTGKIHTHSLPPTAPVSDRQEEAERSGLTSDVAAPAAYPTQRRGTRFRRLLTRGSSRRPRIGNQVFNRSGPAGGPAAGRQKGRHLSEVRHRAAVVNGRPLPEGCLYVCVRLGREDGRRFALKATADCQSALVNEGQSVFRASIDTKIENIGPAAVYS